MGIAPLRGLKGSQTSQEPPLWPHPLIASPPCEGLGPSGAEACTCVLVSLDGPSGSAQRFPVSRGREGVRAELQCSQRAL